MTPDDLDSIRADIIDLHRAFEQCFVGDAAGPVRVDTSLAPDFVFVGPDGQRVARDTVVAGLRGAAGTDLTIEIRRVEPGWQRGDLAGVTYEEWQNGPGGVTARRSSVVVQRDAAAPGGWRWLSVHETWMPTNR